MKAAEKKKGLKDAGSALGVAHKKGQKKKKHVSVKQQIRSMQRLLNKVAYVDLIQRDGCKITCSSLLSIELTLFAALQPHEICVDTPIAPFFAEAPNLYCRLARISRYRRLKR